MNVIARAGCMTPVGCPPPADASAGAGQGAGAIVALGFASL